MKKALYKVPNGKLLKIFLEDSDSRIVSLKITGDFFVHPEENIEILEKELVGAEIEVTTLTDKINNFLKRSQSLLFGLDVNSLVLTIMNAYAQDF